MSTATRPPAPEQWPPESAVSRGRAPLSSSPATCFISPFFILFAIFGLFPIVFTFWVSLHDWSLLGDRSLGRPRQLHGAGRRRATSGTPWSTRSGSSCWRPSRSCCWRWCSRSCSTSGCAARTFWRMGVLLPNITSVAAVGIIFTLLFARDFGLVNWLLGFVGVDTDRLAGPPVVVVAGDLGDGRLALDRLQRADLPRGAAGGAAGPVRGRGDRRRLAAAGSSGASRSRCCGRRSSSSP